MYGVNTLVLIFVGRTQQWQSCGITLLKALSTLCYATLRWLVSLGNHDGNPYPCPLRSDLATMACGRLSLLEDVVVEEVILLVGIAYIFGNGSAVVAFDLHSA